MKRFIVFTCLFLCNALLFAQEGESFPCTCCNAELKELAAGKTIERLYVHGCGGIGMGHLASSFLKPSGVEPKVVVIPGDAPDYSKLDAWTCMYSPGNVTDMNTKTAWVEGMADYGIGEVLIVSCLDLKKPVQIWAGYGKSPAIFTQNSRPKKIKTMIVQGDTPGYTQYGTEYHNLKVVAQADLELQDVNQFQSLTIPPFEIVSYLNKDQNSYVDHNYFLAIQILDVFKGAKWSDTCISEIKNSASTPEEVGTIVYEAFKAYQFDMLDYVIPTMDQIAEKAVQYGEAPMSAADLKNASPMYEMAKTEYKNKCMELQQKIGNQGNGIDLTYSKIESITKTEKEHPLKSGKKIKMTSISISITSNNKKATLVLNKLFQLQGTWYVTPGEIELVQ